MTEFQKIETFKQGFINAFAGVYWAFRSQLNFRFHILGLIFSIALGLVLKINYYEWLLVLTVITGVLTLELVNTSLEQTTNAITKEYNLTIKRAKDTAAAAVLTYAFYAIIVALLIFGPKLVQYFKY